MANAGTVLLKLLKHTSAERLEVMLDPVELLGLLASFGQDKAGIEAQLKRGTKPGELLLALFEEHGADAVWDSLPPRAQTRATEAKKKSDEKVTVSGQLESIGLKRRLGGAVVALTGSVWAAMYILGSTPEWGSGLTLGTLVFAVVAGVAGGAWATRDVAATAGAVAGLVCADHNRDGLVHLCPTRWPTRTPGDHRSRIARGDSRSGDRRGRRASMVRPSAGVLIRAPTEAPKKGGR